MAAWIGLGWLFGLIWVGKHRFRFPGVARSVEGAGALTDNFRIDTFGTSWFEKEEEEDDDDDADDDDNDDDDGN